VKPRRVLASLLVVLAVLIGLLFGLAWIPVAQARAAWRVGRTADALAIAGRWSRIPLWGPQWQQLVAVALLTGGNDAAAEPHLAAMRHLWPRVLGKGEVIRRLAAGTRYRELLDYDAADRAPDLPEMLLDKAGAAAALGRLDLAGAALHAVDPARVDAHRYAAVKAAVEQRQSGAFPYVFDRSGGVLAVDRIADGAVVPADPDFAPLVDRDAGSLTFGARAPRLGTSTVIDTTLDPLVQKAARAALGKYHGAIVAIDPRTNEILAIASSSTENLALERQYEPGSVIKILTGLDALTSGMDVDSMFPYVCSGELDIGGRHFGDWLPQGHGTLRSIDDALAVSCNVFFGDLGEKLGRDRLERTLRSAGFDGQVDLGVFTVPLGRLIGPVDDDFETAYLAIGLDHERINALHLAMLASMMANRGVLTTPRLLRDRRSVFGEIVEGPPVQGRTRVGSAAAAARMIIAMQAVAADPQGTGHRAPVSGIPMAIKTGTAGERKEGLQALILAFAPVESPRIAFGIIAEDAGPAEYAGADIAHDFLERIKSRLN